MIVRKPYAFLIKHFKLIHFFMLLLSVYIIYRTNIIFEFIKEYVTTRKTLIAEYISSDYIPIFLFIAIGLIIFLSLTIFILLKQKDKPKLLYLIFIIFYTILIFILMISSQTISTIIIEGIDPKLARIFRDIFLITIIIQVIFIIFIFIRTVGFDIKKFHFGEDLQELKIEVSDNEEIEIISGINYDKLSINMAIKKEEFKAFYKENKLMIFIIMFLAIIVIPGTFIIKNNIENRHYTENEIIKTSNLKLNVTSSYITKYDYKGNLKLKQNRSYVIAKINIQNITNKDIKLSTENFNLEVNGKIYSMYTKNYNYFYDLGIGYDSQNIETSQIKEYIIVFLVDDNDLKEQMNVRYSINPTSLSKIYKRIDIQPIDLDTKFKNEKVNLGESINFNDSKMLKTSLTLSEYSIGEFYSYASGGKTLSIVNSLGLVVKMKYEFKKDSNVIHISDFNDFLKTYGIIKYIYNDKVYSNEISIITPTNYPTNNVFIAVDERVKDATKCSIVFNIRNKIYEIVIK